MYSVPFGAHHQRLLYNEEVGLIVIRQHTLTQTRTFYDNFDGP